MRQPSEAKRINPPKVYYIELTNYCNLRCSMCNFHSTITKPDKVRNKGFMDMKLAKNLIEQIGSLGADAWVAFHGAGESMLHKGLLEIFSYAARFKNIRYGFLTNGMFLDETAGSEIIDSGISWVGFSLDGIDKEKFERYRKGSDFDRIMKNVIHFLDMKNRKCKNINTKVNMTVQAEMEGDVDKFINFWIERVDEVLISPCKPVGSRESSLVDKTVARIPCYMLYEMMVVYWDGSVGLCCEDWYNDGRLGDVSREGIINVWNGQIFSKVRELHEKGDFRTVPLCGDCDSWYNGVREEYFDEKRNCKVMKNAWQHVYMKC